MCQNKLAELDEIATGLEINEDEPDTHKRGSSDNVKTSKKRKIEAQTPSTTSGAIPNTQDFLDTISGSSEDEDDDSTDDSADDTFINDESEYEYDY